MKEKKEQNIRAVYIVCYSEQEWLCPFWHFIQLLPFNVPIKYDVSKDPSFLNWELMVIKRPKKKKKSSNVAKKVRQIGKTCNESCC